MTATLEQLLETLVRPALRTHNGDVELVGYQDGILRLRMLGQWRRLSRRRHDQRDLDRGSAHAPAPRSEGGHPGPHR